MLAFAVGSAALTPTRLLANSRPHRVDIEQAVPAAFGDWRIDDSVISGIVNPQDTEVLNRIYTQTLSRVYTDGRGHSIMMTIAYGADQSKREGLQLHYPEVCYPAQGFEVRSNRVGEIAVPGGAIPVRRLETVLSGQRYEPVTYWTMTGDEATLGGIQKKIVEFRYSLHGLITDGLLFRVSSIGTDSAAQFALQERFVRDLLAGVKPADRPTLFGRT